jgi:hypothetical protein
MNNNLYYNDKLTKINKTLKDSDETGHADLIFRNFSNSEAEKTVWSRVDSSWVA